MDVDVKGKRLSVAGLENGSREVVDLRAGKWLKSIPGFKKTQGIPMFAPSIKFSWPVEMTGCPSYPANWR